MSQPATRADVEQLYRQHAGELHGYLQRRGGAAGADLLGDVLVVALQRLADLPEPTLRRAWLFGTARRLLLASHRTSRRRGDAEAQHARAQVSTALGPDERPNRHAAVRQALESLREPDRELIRLTEWEQLTIHEAALVLGIRPGTARVRIHRARRALAAHPLLKQLAAHPTVDPRPDPVGPPGVPP
ncbi:RNA polymerase sigma factor [Nocardioides aurantiacus]|uniref:RNA polymerase sigma-70 factor (ECF subfamily) n=1 Tax=Nocardioides aurantiacus TaxID=86796 RepID=A0A3N2CU42_9ACTN|nr:RNA polymerase sigma-70 factor (ECF subfamily) [Nocardioides aurantiacus]